MPEPRVNILIVDDTEANRYAIRRHLQRAGYDVCEAETAQQGFLLAQQNPDLIILDVKLPDQPGYEVCQMLKRNPVTCHIPVLQISAAFNLSSDKVRSLEAGADAFLSSPVDQNELLANVKVLLRLHHAQESLRQTNERLNSVLASITDARFVLDEDWRLVEMNPATETIFGPVAERIGKVLWEEFPHATKSEFYRQYHIARQQKAPVHFEAKSLIVDRWFEAHAYPRKDKLEVYLRDITERKQAEHILRTQYDRLRLLSEAMAHLLTSRDITTVVGELFPKVAAHLGIDTYLNYFLDDTGGVLLLHSYSGISESMANLIRRLEPGQEVFGAAARLRQPVIITDARASGEPDLALIRRLGIRSCACNPLIVNDQLLGTIAFASRCRDCFEPDELDFIRAISRYVALALDRLRTEDQLRLAKSNLEQEVHRRTAKLQEAINELEGFTYSITHDMRAPLRAMEGFCRILLAEEASSVSADGKDYLERIANAARRLDLLILDVLNYSKIVRAEIPLQPVSLDKLLRDIIREYPVFQAPDVRIEIHGSIPSVLGNAGLLTQCFSNLLTNAVKFVAAGTAPQIQISSERNDRFVRFCVRDNGIGIRPEHCDRIFKMFERLHGLDEYPGTGVGLAIVRKAVERMEGRVGVDSSPGQGSTFWVDLLPA